MQTIDELEKTYQRIRKLEDITGYSMIELLSHSAESLMDCDKCPMWNKCDEDMKRFMTGNYEYNSCEDVWKDYLTLKIDGKEQEK